MPRHRLLALSLLILCAVAAPILAAEPTSRAPILLVAAEDLPLCGASRSGALTNDQGASGLRLRRDSETSVRPRYVARCTRGTRSANAGNRWQKAS